MKYIIRESKLIHLVIEYIDSLLDSENYSQYRDFILLQDKTGEEDWEDLLEYDYSDGRLWINSQLLGKLRNMFGLSFGRLAEMIKERLEKKFDVKVAFMEYGK